MAAAMRALSGIVMLAAMVVAGCSYSHIARQSASFRPAGNGEWSLRVERQMDTVWRGPETEELQVLTIWLREPRPARRYVVPSAEARAELEIRRFGLSSRGQQYRGQILVHAVTNHQVVADLRLVIEANTPDGWHPQTVKFRGRHVFWPGQTP